MKENIQEQTRENRRLFTVSQFAKRQSGSWPSEPALRALILDAAWGNNSFQSAFKRVNRRVLIDEIEFWNCVDRMQEKK